jgi:hypothetical protein
MSFLVQFSSGKMSPLQSAIAFTLSGVFPAEKFKKPIINLGVGRHGGQEGVEVCPVGTVTCVVTLFIEAWQRNGANSRVYEKEAEEEK